RPDYRSPPIHDRGPVFIWDRPVKDDDDLPRRQTTRERCNWGRMLREEGAGPVCKPFEDRVPIPKILYGRPGVVLRLRVADRLVDHARLVCELDPPPGAYRLLWHEPPIHCSLTRIAEPVARAHVGRNGDLDQPVGFLNPRQFSK